MSKENNNDELVQMYRDLAEIFDEEYEKRRLITPQNTAEKMTAKGYRKQSVGRWIFKGTAYGCSLCGEGVIAPIDKYCRNCGARMKGGAE